MKILVTGTAGFIGFHTANSLINAGHEVLGIDNINEYYDPKLKISRLGFSGINTSLIQYNTIITSKSNPKYSFLKVNIEDRLNIDALFNNYNFDVVVHLAAQAGVRYSMENPEAYIQSNLQGFFNIINASATHKIKHFVYASSSSVYG